MTSFIKDESGGIAEYSAILAMVLIIAVGCMTFIAPKIRNVFQAIAENLDDSE